MHTCEASNRWANRLTLTAGSLASLSLLPGGAAAGVIHVTGRPVSLGLDSEFFTIVTWDVDGSGGYDFGLGHQGDPGYGAIMFGHFSGNGGSMVISRGSTTSSSWNLWLPLQVSNLVGPTLQVGSSAVWYSLGFADWYALFTTDGYIQQGYYLDEGDNYIGFSFLSDGDMLYGFANFNIDMVNGVVSITDWYYNDQPDEPLHVEVPEPGTAALALLGLGAGGLRAWRARRKAERAAVPPSS